MSKRQKRLIRREKRKQQSRGGSHDRHHILYQRVNWSRGALTILRQYHYCKVYIPRDLHDRIHENVRNIAPPRLVNAIDAIKQLRDLELHDSINELDDFEKRLKVLIFMFEYIEPETTECLKRQLEIVHEYYEPS